MHDPYNYRYMRRKHAQVKDSNGVTGQGRTTCPFYNELDAILGTRAASRPHIVLDTSSGAGFDLIPPEVVDSEGK